LNPYTVILGTSLIWLAVVVSPGPNFLIVSRLALSRSRRSAIGATFGITVGSLSYAALTMFGLSVMMLRFAWLGDTVRIVGGAYLVWLGIQAWRTRPEEMQPAAASADQGGPSLLHGLRVGFLTEITNPKGIAFFLGLFATAVPAAAPLWAKLAVLSVGGVIEVAWYTAKVMGCPPPEPICRTSAWVSSASARASKPSVPGGLSESPKPRMSGTITPSPRWPGLAPPCARRGRC